MPQNLLPFVRWKLGFWAVPTLRAAAWAFLPSHEVHFVAEPGLFPVERLKMGCRWGTDEELMRNWWGTDEELMRNWWGTDEELMRNWWGTDEELMSSHLCAELDRRLWQAGLSEIWQNQVCGGTVCIILTKNTVQKMYSSSCSSAWFHQIEQRALNHLQNNLQIGYQLHSPVELVISHGFPAHSWQWVVPKFTQNTRKSLRKQRKPKYSGIFRFWGHRHIKLYSCTTPYETCCWWIGIGVTVRLLDYYSQLRPLPCHCSQASLTACTWSTTVLASTRGSFKLSFWTLECLCLLIESGEPGRNLENTGNIISANDGKC